MKLSKHERELILPLIPLPDQYTLLDDPKTWPCWAAYSNLRCLAIMHHRRSGAKAWTTSQQTTGRRAHARRKTLLTLVERGVLKRRNHEFILNPDLLDSDWLRALRLAKEIT